MRFKFLDLPEHEVGALLIWPPRLVILTYIYIYMFHINLAIQPSSMVAEWVQLELREIENSVPGRVNPITYQIDTCHFLAWCSALIE